MIVPIVPFYVEYDNEIYQSFYIKDDTGKIVMDSVPLNYYKFANNVKTRLSRRFREHFSEYFV